MIQLSTYAYHVVLIAGRVFVEVRKLLSQVPFDDGDLQYLTTELDIQEAPVHQLSVHFTGRHYELARIKDSFAADKDATIRSCVVHRMAGNGKTLLVLSYAKAAYERCQYKQIFWILARTNERVLQGLAGLLNLVRHVDRHNLEDPAKMIAARRWLEERRSTDHMPWLLVFDNVARDTIENLRTHLPRNN